MVLIGWILLFLTIPPELMVSSTISIPKCRAHSDRFVPEPSPLINIPFTDRISSFTDNPALSAGESGKSDEIFAVPPNSEVRIPQCFSVRSSKDDSEYTRSRLLGPRRRGGLLRNGGWANHRVIEWQSGKRYELPHPS